MMAVRRWPSNGVAGDLCTAVARPRYMFAETHDASAWHRAADMRAVVACCAPGHITSACHVCRSRASSGTFVPGRGPESLILSSECLILVLLGTKNQLERPWAVRKASSCSST